MSSVDLLDGRIVPPEWEFWSESERLDWIATRILAEDRNTYETTAHEDYKGGIYYGYGYLSEAQEERRKRKEFYWYRGPDSIDWLDKKLKSGQLYSRSYANNDMGQGYNPIQYTEEGNIPSSYRNAKTSTD